MLQKACACYPFARKEQGSVHRDELFLLWTILQKEPALNMGYYMVKHLERASKKDSGFICVGKVVAAIALHLGVDTGSWLPDLGREPLGLSYLSRAGMINVLNARVCSRPTRIMLVQRQKDNFPLPNPELTYVNGPDNKANWGMNTQAHKALIVGEGAGAGPSSSSSDEEAEYEAEDEEEEQPESSSRAKRSRPEGSTSMADHMQTLIQGMSSMQFSQAQQSSILEGMQQWHQAELEWRAGVDARLTAIEETQEAQGAHLNHIQMQYDLRWTQQQAWRAQEEAQEAEQRAFFQAYYSRFPPQD